MSDSTPSNAAASGGDNTFVVHVDKNTSSKNNSGQQKSSSSSNRKRSSHQISAASDDPGNDGGNAGDIYTMGEEKMLREQDRFLPIANISRIMKRYIPESGKIAKDAKECVQECVSEFVSFITSEASERCHNEKRKTINGEDILWAMQTLGFEPYVEPLKLYLSKYRAACKGDKALQEMGLAPDDQEIAEAAQSAATITHADLSILGTNQILLNTADGGISLVTADGERAQTQTNQVAFLTTAPGGQQQIMYLENFPTAAFQTTGQQTTTGQPQFITINRPTNATGLQFLQLVPATSLATGTNGQTVVASNHGP